MNKEAQELYIKNYNNEGLCKGLENKIKSFEKGYKNNPKTISYLPWAIAERIFRLQGGKIEVVDWKYDVNFEEQVVDIDTGELITKKQDSYFLKLKGTWMGEELEEYYPIFDNQTSRVVKTPDAQQLNTSRQRGSVRLIARLTGIGLWIFEQQDNQFEDDGKEENIKPTKIEQETQISAKKKSKVKEEIKKEPVVEQEQDGRKINLNLEKKLKKEVKEGTEENGEDMINMFFGDMVKEESKKEEISTPELPEEPTFSNDSEEHSDLLMEVKSHIRTHRDLILNFIEEKNREKLSDLNYNELKELLSRINQ